MIKVIGSLIGRGLTGLVRGAGSVVKSVARGAGTLAAETYLGMSDAYHQYRLDKKFSEVDPNKREEMDRLMGEYKKLDLHDYEDHHSYSNPSSENYKKGCLNWLTDSYRGNSLNGVNYGKPKQAEMEHYDHALNLVDRLYDEGAISERKRKKMLKKISKKVKKSLAKR